MTTVHQTRRAENPRHGLAMVGCTCGWIKEHRATRPWGWPIIRELAAQSEAAHREGHGAAEGVALHVAHQERLCGLCQEFEVTVNIATTRTAAALAVDHQHQRARQAANRVAVNSEALVAARQAAGLSPSELGRRISGGQTVVWGMENGRNGSGARSRNSFPRDTVARVAEVLGVSIETIIRDEEGES